MTHAIPLLELTDEIWIPVKDGNATAHTLFQRHYSKYHYKDGRKPKLFMGPGEKIVLVTHDGLAMFTWRRFIDASGQKGINNSIFRNESSRKSSDLILEAEKFAQERWPGERMYTYVNGSKIRSTNPGYCFQMAGWKKCGQTKGGLTILEKIPN